MKQLFAILVSIGILLSLTGCIVWDAKEDRLDKTELKPTKGETQPDETKPEDTQPEETEFPVPPELNPEDTQPEETQPLSDTSYLQNIKWANQPIYSGPGYEYDYVQTVEIAGTYTIVAEAYDAEGHLWGKLKSGIGWVDLTNIRYAEGHRGEEAVTLTADFVSDTEQGDLFLLYDRSEYAVRIGITAHQEVSFQFYTTDLTDAGYDIGDVLQAGTLRSGEMFVAQVAFPGDMTTYGMTVTDKNGSIQQYVIYISGMDGSLLCQEYHIP